MAGRSHVEVPAPLLRTLHRIQQQRTDLIGRIDRGPRQIAAAQALVTAAQQAVDNATDALKQARLRADEKQLQLQTREDHVKALQVKLNSAASNREFDLLKDQIAADEQANSVQSDEIFETLESIDRLSDELQARQNQLEKTKQESAQRIKQINANVDKVRSDLERVELEHAQTESQLPGEARTLYVRLTASRGEDALAPLDGESCGGCYQVLTTQVVNELQLSRLTHCPNCNSILYLPEDLRVR